jgi:hypothetical protein
MRRLLAIVLPTVLLLCAPAAAKEVTAATVCGDDGCRPVDGADESLLQSGPPTDGPSQREPFVRLEFQIAAGPDRTERIRHIFLPRSGLLLAGDGATWMRPIALATLRREAQRVTTFPASRLPAGAPLAARAPGRSPAAAHPSSSSSEGASAWWPALPVGVLVLVLVLALAAGAALARRTSARHV